MSLLTKLIIYKLLLSVSNTFENRFDTLCVCVCKREREREKETVNFRTLPYKRLLK